MLSLNYSDWLKKQKEYNLKFTQNNLLSYIISLKDRFPINIPERRLLKTET